MTLMQLWGNFVLTFGTWGRLWGHFGVTLGALAAYGGDFGATLGSLWGQFGYLWVTLSLGGHFAIIVESLWVYKGPCSKSIHFPHR